MGGEPFYFAAEDAGEWAGVLPAVAFGAGPLRRLQSMPDGCYGGVFMAEDVENPAALRRALVNRLSREPWFRVHLVDFDDAMEPEGFSRVDCQTRVVDIRDPDWQPADKKLQSQIRSAERHGLEMERFQWSRHGSDFMRLVRLTSRRHRHAPRQGAEFYRALAELADREDRIRWVWCSWQGQPLCSHVYFRERNMLQGWEIQFDKSMSRLKPNQFVRHRMCLQMAREGCTHLNLGATPRGAEGLLYYKRRWGGDVVEYPTWIRRSRLARLLRR